MSGELTSAYRLRAVVEGKGSMRSINKLLEWGEQVDLSINLDQEYEQWLKVHEEDTQKIKEEDKLKTKRQIGTLRTFILY